MPWAIGERQPWIVLDAMGVLYESGDDMREIVVPVVKGCGSASGAAEIEDLYRQALVGGLSTEQFWHACGVESHDDELIASYRPMSGIIDALTALRAAGHCLACLSNDVSEWSLLRRIRLGMSQHIERWFVSGELGGCASPILARMPPLERSGRRWP